MTISLLDLLVAFCVLSMVGMLFLTESFRLEVEDANPRRILGGFFRWMSILLSGVMILGAPFAWPLLRRSLMIAPQSLVRATLGVALIVSVASLLFALKIKALRIYAIVEVLFALGMAGRTMQDVADEIGAAQALGLLTSAYLMIRGMDNFKKDLDERRKAATATPPAPGSA